MTPEQINKLAVKLAWLTKFPGQQRCPVCSFPLADSIDKGCVIGNCSYRPSEGTAEYERVVRNRADLGLAATIIVAELQEAANG